MDHTADHWRQAMQCVAGEGWQPAEYAPESPLEAAVQQAYAVEQIDGNEGVVAAAIEACATLWQAWEPPALLDMARAFMCAYADLDTVRQQHLDEHYPGTQVSWFKEDAPVWGEVVSEDEIMVECNGAVYFFAKPGTSRYARLIER